MVRHRVVTSPTAHDEASVWPVYDAVFGDQPDERTWREQVWDRHTGRPGFRLALAEGPDGLLGLAYGYTGERGQWWTDTVERALGPRVADAWLGGHFEVVSIGVLPSARGAGLGRGLLRALLDDLPHTRLLLMTTADPTDAARRLYAAEGWRVLGRGTAPDTVTMGRHGAVPGPTAAARTGSGSDGTADVIRSLDLRPILYVEDPRAERDFLATFGFTTAYEGEEFAGFLAVQRGGVLVGLSGNRGALPAAAHEGTQWQFTVDGVGAVLAVCRREGWAHEVDVVEVGDAYRVRTVRVTSPNGVVHWFEGPNELA